MLLYNLIKLLNFLIFRVGRQLRVCPILSMSHSLTEEQVSENSENLQSVICARRYCNPPC